METNIIENEEHTLNELNLDNTIEINKEKWIKTELVDWAISRMQ
jgi:hypothetical protein